MAAEPATPLDSPLRMSDVLASPAYRALSTPDVRPGDDAVDFELPLLDADRRPAGQTVRLADFADERPVALMFGSYT